MIIGERLRQLREAMKISQGVIEKKTGLLRCYISRVENGHTVPSVETLQKWAGALEMPLYRLFYDGPVPKAVSKAFSTKRPAVEPAETKEMKQLRKWLPNISDRDRVLLMRVATIMAGRARK